jgi:hypothetical protein
MFDEKGYELQFIVCCLNLFVKEYVTTVSSNKKTEVANRSDYFSDFNYNLKNVNKLKENKENKENREDKRNKISRSQPTTPIIHPSSPSSSVSNQKLDIHFCPLEISDHLLFSNQISNDLYLSKTLPSPSPSSSTSSSLFVKPDSFPLFSLLYQLSTFLIIEPSLFLEEKIRNTYCPDISFFFFFLFVFYY